MINKVLLINIALMLSFGVMLSYCNYLFADENIESYSYIFENSETARVMAF